MLIYLRFLFTKPVNGLATLTITNITVILLNRQYTGGLTGMKELLWNMFEISVNVSEILMVYQKAGKLYHESDSSQL